MLLCASHQLLLGPRFGAGTTRIGTAAYTAIARPIASAISLLPLTRHPQPLRLRQRAPWRVLPATPRPSMHSNSLQSLRQFHSA